MFETLLARLAVGCGLYQPTVALLTAVTTGVLAAVILYLHRSALAEERWAKYFGVFFAILALQYLPQAANHAAALWGFAQPIAHWIEKIAIPIGSAANNLLILATAIALLFPDTQRQPRPLEQGLARRRLSGGRSPFFSFHKGDFPNWAIPLALLTGLIYSFRPESFLHRLPNALFSAGCLIFLGVAISLNFGPRKRRFLASINLVGAFLYAFVQIVHAWNPWISRGILWPDLARSINRELDVFRSSPELARFAEKVTTLSALDSLVYAVAFLLKISLFLGALLLIIRLLMVLSPPDQRRLLENITWERGNYLDAQGVLKALGETVAADMISLNIRRPERDPVRVELMTWQREPLREIPERIVRDLLPAEESIVSWVMQEGLEQVSCPNLAKADPEVCRRYLSYVPEMKSFVTLPIVYQGAIIACLNLEWKNRFGFTATTVQRIRQMAELMAPTIFAYRQLVALDILAEQFRYFKPDPGDKPEPRPLENLVGIVHQTLSPLATGLALTIGFRRPWASCSDQTTIFGDASQKQNLLFLASGHPDAPPVLVEQDLIVHGTTIGRLILAIDPDRDPLNRPSLAADPLHRQAVASLLADAILDDMEERLTRILNYLQIKLNAISSTDVETWFKYVQAAAQRAGFLWAVARLVVHETLLGRPEGREIIKNLPLASLPLQGQESREPRCLKLADPAGETRSVIALSLPNAEGQLWLGFRWDDLTEEMSFLSPWKTFLTRFAEAADLALNRLARHRQQLEAKEFERVAMRVETTGLLMHTLGNDATELLHGTERLEDIMPAVGSPMTKEVKDRILGLRKSTQSFTKLAATFKSRVPADDRQRVSLTEVLDRIRTLYEDNFRDHSIEIDNQIPPDLVVGAPIDISYVALITLVINASESIRRGGTIRISIEENGNRYLCHVEDDGPGIQKEVLDKILRTQVTTKRNGTGIGLQLARNSMLRCGGDLKLTHTRPGSTLFTLYFPK